MNQERNNILLHNLEGKQNTCALNISVNQERNNILLRDLEEKQNNKKQEFHMCYLEF